MCSSNSINANVRIIAATNKDLYDMVQNNLFREDLYYRLNVFPIHIAPLNERQKDIITITNHFINEYNHSFQQQKLNLSDNAKRFLLNYDFSGNVRELRNIIEYAFIKSNDFVIKISDFPSYVTKELYLNSNKQTININSKNQLYELSKKREKQHILKVIKHCNGNKSAAARKLGISRKTIYNKLQ